MARIKVRNLKRDANQRVRLVKTATSGGTGIGEQTGAVFETPLEIGFCLTPDSVLTDVIAFPQSQAEMTEFLAANPKPDSWDIFGSGRTTVTKHAIDIDYPDISAGNNQPFVLYFGWAFNKQQVDQCILLADTTAVYGKRSTWSGDVNEEPTFIEQDLTYQELLAMTQTATIWKDRYVVLNRVPLDKIHFAEKSSVKLKDVNGPYNEVAITAKAKVGYASPTTLVISPKDSAEFLANKDKHTFIQPGSFLLDPHLLNTVVDAQANKMTVTGRIEKPEDGIAYLNVYARINKTQLDTALASGLSDDHVLGGFNVNRQDDTNVSVEQELTVGVLRASIPAMGVDGDEYLFPFVLDSDLYNKGQVELSLNLSTETQPLAKNTCYLDFDFKLKDYLDMQNWPESQEEYEAWAINHGASFPSNYLNPFLLQRTASKQPGYLNIEYKNIPRLDIGKVIPEGFKIHSMRVNQFMSKSEPDAIMGVYRQTKPDGTVETTNLTVASFNALIDNGTVRLINDYYIFPELMAVPTDTATIEGDMAMALEIWSGTLPSRQIKNKRKATVRAQESVNARFFPQDKAEQDKVTATLSSPFINLFDPANVEMTGMSNNDVKIKFLKTVDQDVGKIIPCGYSYDKTQLDELIASKLPDSTVVSRTDFFNGPTVVNPPLQKESMTLGALRGAMLDGAFASIDGRYYQLMGSQLYHKNYTTIKNAIIDWDDDETTYVRTIINVNIVEVKAPEVIRAAMYGYVGDEFAKLTAAGFDVTDVIDLTAMNGDGEDDPVVEISANNFSVTWKKPPEEVHNKRICTFVKYDMQQVDEMLDDAFIPPDAVVLISTEANSGTELPITKEQFEALVLGDETKIIDGFYVMRIFSNYIVPEESTKSNNAIKFTFGGPSKHIPVTLYVDLEIDAVIKPVDAFLYDFGNGGYQKLRDLELIGENVVDNSTLLAVPGTSGVIDKDQFDFTFPKPDFTWIDKHCMVFFSIDKAQADEMLADTNISEDTVVMSLTEHAESGDNTSTLTKQTFRSVVTNLSAVIDGRYIWTNADFVFAEDQGPKGSITYEFTYGDPKYIAKTIPVKIDVGAAEPKPVDIDSRFMQIKYEDRWYMEGLGVDISYSIDPPSFAGNEGFDTNLGEKHFEYNWSNANKRFIGNYCDVIISINKKQVADLFANVDVADDAIVMTVTPVGQPTVNYTKAQFKTDFIENATTKSDDNVYFVRMSRNHISAMAPVDDKATMTLDFHMDKYLPITLQWSIDVNEVITSPATVYFQPDSEDTMNELRASLTAVGNEGVLDSFLPEVYWNDNFGQDENNRVYTVNDIPRNMMFSYVPRLFALYRHELDAVLNYIGDQDVVLTVGEGETAFDVTKADLVGMGNEGWKTSLFYYIPEFNALGEQSGEVSQIVTIKYPKALGYHETVAKYTVNFEFNAPAKINVRSVAFNAEDYAQAAANNSWTVGTQICDFNPTDYERTNSYNDFKRIVRNSTETLDAVIAIEFTSPDWQYYQNLGNGKVIASIQRTTNGAKENVDMLLLFGKGVPMRDQSNTVVGFLLPVLMGVKEPTDVNVITVTNATDSGIVVDEIAAVMSASNKVSNNPAGVVTMSDAEVKEADRNVGSDTMPGGITSIIRS